MHRRGFSPLVPDIHHARYGDLESVRAMFRTICPPDELAAIFVEPIQGEGGYIVPPPTFCRACAGCATSTECSWFSTRSRAAWAGRARCSPAEHWGVAGDILCMAKGIANGLPLGAIVAKASVMDWPSGSHASTFGGNPVACAASLATIRLLETRYMRQCPSSAANSFATASQRLAHRFSFIREVRGLGLMIGLEIQSESGEPDPGLRDELIDMAFHRGLFFCLAAPARSGSARRCA